jgi:hypothetical protein
MPAERTAVRRLRVLFCLPAFCILSGAGSSAAQTTAPLPGVPTPGQGQAEVNQALVDQALVDRALANELRAARDSGHPMRYVLRKTTPRLTTTKEIFETKDGAVARLISINGLPLSAADEQREQARLDALLADPDLQRRRRQAEIADTGRALKVLRVLPRAFLYQYAGSSDGPAGKIEKFTFKPNPDFTPPDLETEVLTEMSGTIWIDAAQERVTRLEGHLDQNVDFGWGALGRLNKGGWIAIDQADVGGNQWRTVRFQMAMSGRVFFRTRVFDTTEEEKQFAPVPIGTSYAQAIEILRSEAGAAGGGR